MNLVVFILNDPERLEEVLAAWQQAGVPGATILHTTGLGRVQNLALREDTPIFPSLEALLQGGAAEDFNRTIFSVVEDPYVVQDLIRVTQDVLGDLSQPNTGLLFVVPVTQVYGLHKSYHSR